jgi:hypothetical protein
MARRHCTKRDAAVSIPSLIQRCQVHELQTIPQRLPEIQRPRVRAIVARAYKQVDVTLARRLPQDRARRLGDRYPSAVASVREGVNETLTILTLGLSIACGSRPRPRRSKV